jgi:hypothetical protein
MTKSNAKSPAAVMFDAVDAALNEQVLNPKPLNPQP